MLAALGNVSPTHLLDRGLAAKAPEPAESPALLQIAARPRAGSA